MLHSLHCSATRLSPLSNTYWWQHSLRVPLMGTSIIQACVCVCFTYKVEIVCLCKCTFCVFLKNKISEPLTYLYKQMGCTHTQTHARAHRHLIFSLSFNETEWINAREKYSSPKDNFPISRLRFSSYFIEIASAFFLCSYTHLALLRPLIDQCLFALSLILPF